MEALLPRFRTAHTQVLGVSVDSVYSHANWARDLGGISFPLLADFQPRGALASSFGAFLEDAGITDRATVIVDSDGIVRHASSVTPAGQRDPAELAALCEQIDRDASGATEPFAAPAGLPGDAVLYVKSHCGFSRAALLARDNLHLRQKLPVKNVSESDAARDELVSIAGDDSSPCLVVSGEPTRESVDIIAFMVERAVGPL